MFTNVHLALHPVWDDLLWSATAIWDEGDGTAPVVLSKTGQVPLRGVDSPHDMLALAVAALSDEMHLASDELLGLSVAPGAEHGELIPDAH